MDHWKIAGGFFVLGIAADSVVQHTVRVRCMERPSDGHLRDTGFKEQKRFVRHKKELELLKRAEEIQASSIEESRRELEKVRHDLNNHLVTAYRLVKEGEADKARELLDDVRNLIAGDREYEYCRDAIVNAVFMERAPICRERDILLYVDMGAFGKTEIKPAHLCSVFANLLDNAILAAGKCRRDNRFVRVRASRKGDYFLIKVENSTLEAGQAQGKKKEGYGQQILRGIAGYYKGEFWTQWKDGVYTACISLLAEGNN